MMGDDESELVRIDERIERIDEELNNHETQPTDSLTGLEEALEELRRYDDGTEDAHTIDFRNMQPVQRTSGINTFDAVFWGTRYFCTKLGGSFFWKIRVEKIHANRTVLKV